MKKLSLLLGLFLLLSIGMTSQTFAQNQELVPHARVDVFISDISCITNATDYTVRIIVLEGGLGGIPYITVQPFVVGQSTYSMIISDHSYIAASAQLLYQGEVVSLGGTTFIGYVYDHAPATVYVNGPCPEGNQ
ncbi:MAG TPA: hypothetical protein PKJ28_02495 [Bacteroidales bacterium]|nr:hypothetical protein [Bacteroidales bacterium]HPS73543.1 hypothetical protein [Bacteroidales bacterium]